MQLKISIKNRGILGLLLTASALAAPLTSAQAEVKVGQKIPAFTVTDLNGRVIKSSSLRGKPIWIVSFFASCPPCNAEAPLLQKAWREFSQRGGVVLGLRPEEDSVSELKAFRTRHKVTYPIVHEKGDKTLNRFDLGFPATVLVDRKGIVRFVDSNFSAAQFKSAKTKFQALLRR